MKLVPCLETSKLSSFGMSGSDSAASHFIYSAASGRKEFIICICASAINRQGPRSGIHQLSPPPFAFH